MTAAPWSLRNRLTLTLGAATLLIWCASSLWLYRAVIDTANRLFDAALDNTAHAVLAVVRNEASELTETKEGVGFELAVIDQSSQTDTVYQVLGPNGIMVFRSHGAPIAPLAGAQKRGFGITRIGGEDYRVFTLATELNAATIHVAQPMFRRIELARAGALRLQIPGAALMLALIGAVALECTQGYGSNCPLRRCTGFADCGGGRRRLTPRRLAPGTAASVPSDQPPDAARS